MNNVNLLSTYQLVTLDDDLFAVQPTRKKHSTRLQLAYQLVVIFRACSSATGRLMARYCVAFETMKNFYDIQGDDTIQTLVRNLNKEYSITKIVHGIFVIYSASLKLF